MPAPLRARNHRGGRGALRRLIERSPDDPSAHHNLGTLLLRAGPGRRRRGVLPPVAGPSAPEPRHAPAFGLCPEVQGLVTEAEAAWSAALRMAPGDAATRDELSRLRRWRVVVQDGLYTLVPFQSAAGRNAGVATTDRDLGHG